MKAADVEAAEAAANGKSKELAISERQQEGEKEHEVSLMYRCVKRFTGQLWRSIAQTYICMYL